MSSNFEFKNCCFCVELRTGALIIGYVTLVGNFLLAISLIVGLATVPRANFDSRTQIPPELMKSAILVPLISVALAIVLVNIMFTGVLLMGIHKNKRDYVKTYIIFNVIFIIVFDIAFLIGISTVVSATTIIRDVLATLLSIYFLLVIRSYYLKMDDSANIPAIYNTPQAVPEQK